MWLLNTVTRKLHYFNSEEEVPGGYAILSHTWGDGEVSFDEVDHHAFARKEGHTKIRYTCTQALEDGCTYAWVDTCQLRIFCTSSVITDIRSRLHRQTKQC